MEKSRPGRGVVRLKKAASPQPTSSGYESPGDDGTYTYPSSSGATEKRGNYDSNNNSNNNNQQNHGRGSKPDLESGLDRIVSRARRAPPWGRKVGFRDRIRCYQWTWFTMTMATGGVANVLYSIPSRPQWITIVGLIFCLLNLCLFVINCVCITLRFCWQPGSFLHSFMDQREALFVPAVFVSIGSISINICEYGIPHAGPWLLQVMRAIFWIYLGLVTLASAGMYLILWSTQVFPIHTMTPIWVFPAYPLLLIAPFGSSLTAAAAASNHLHSIDTLVVALASVVVQGTGFLISFMVSSAFLYRLMTQKLPRDEQRPGVFISIGPSAFTVSGLVSFGNQAEQILPADFLGIPESVPILRLLAYLVGLWLWGLSIWFFFVSVGSLWKYLFPEHRSKMPFQMTWFSFVFPNSALVTATEQIAKAFDSIALQVVSYVLTGILIVVWLVVFACMLRSLYKRQLLWPKEEDYAGP